MRPFAGVIDRPVEILGPLEGRTVRRRQAADRHDAEFCGDLVAAIGLDLPAFGSLVEGRCNHACVEHDLPPQIEAIRDMVGIAKDFGLRRIFLRPAPFLVQLFREREGILQAFDIAARAWIAVPVPGAANAAAGLEHLCRKAEPSQTMQHVHAGKARADDDGVVHGSCFGAACSAVGNHGRLRPC